MRQHELTSPSFSVRDEYLPFGQPNFSDAEVEAVTRVLRSGWVGMGPETLAFERELCKYLGAPHVVSVNSCTSALFLSLHVTGVGPGDEVIVPSMTWCSTANVALQLGARPVFCDVDPETHCVTAKTVAEKLSARTKAVIMVHYGGLACPVDSIRALLPSNVALIEDAAHAIGARYRGGAPVGSSGNLVCFSFYANKNVSTGEGGAIALHDPSVAERLRLLRQSALPRDAWKRFTDPRTVLMDVQLKELGYKMNFTDLQASIGRVQLARQDEFRRRRLAIAQRYADRLPDIVPGVQLQEGLLDEYHARHLFVIRLPQEIAHRRNEILLALREKHVGASIHYLPLHPMPLYERFGPTASLPHTESLGQRIITLPISASMTVEDAEYALDALRSCVETV